MHSRAGVMDAERSFHTATLNPTHRPTNRLNAQTPCITDRVLQVKPAPNKLNYGTQTPSITHPLQHIPLQLNPGT